MAMTQAEKWRFRHKVFSDKDYELIARDCSDIQLVKYINRCMGYESDFVWKRPALRKRRREYVAEALLRGLIPEAPPFLGT